MHLANFGSDKIVRTYGRPPLHVSWGETAFQAPRAFGGKSHGHPDFKREGEKTTTRQPSLSFDKILMPTLRWETKKELKQEIHNNGDQFYWRKNVRKWEMLAAN